MPRTDRTQHRIHCQTILHCATENNAIETVKLLLDHGANIDCHAEVGAFMSATAYGLAL